MMRDACCAPSSHVAIVFMGFRRIGGGCDERDGFVPFWLGCRPLRGQKHARGMHDRDRRVCAHCVKCKALSLHFDGVCDEDC